MSRFGLLNPLRPTNTVLHQVVRAHLDRFLAETVAARGAVRHVSLRTPPTWRAA